MSAKYRRLSVRVTLGRWVLNRSVPESSIRVGTWISGTDLVYGVFFGGKAYKRIKPREIIIYSLDRSSPEEKLMKVEKEELAAIGKRIEEATGIPVQVN